MYIFRLLRDQLLAGDFAANVKLLQVRNINVPLCICAFIFIIIIRI